MGTSVSRHVIIPNGAKGGVVMAVAVVGVDKVIITTDVTTADAPMVPVSKTKARLETEIRRLRRIGVVSSSKLVPDERAVPEARLSVMVAGGVSDDGDQPVRGERFGENPTIAEDDLSHGRLMVVIISLR